MSTGNPASPEAQTMFASTRAHATAAGAVVLASAVAFVSPALKIGRADAAPAAGPATPDFISGNALSGDGFSIIAGEAVLSPIDPEAEAAKVSPMSPARAWVEVAKVSYYQLPNPERFADSAYLSGTTIRIKTRCLPGWHGEKLLEISPKGIKHRYCDPNMPSQTFPEPGKATTYRYAKDLKRVGQTIASSYAVDPGASTISRVTATKKEAKVTYVCPENPVAGDVKSLVIKPKTKHTVTDC